MSGISHQDGFEGPAESPRRGRSPYVAPPHIRTTGEVPAITGEIPASQLPDANRDPAADRSEIDGRWSGGGSVVDRPPPSPPDWMSGVQIPALLVSRVIDRGEFDRVGRSGFVATAQRIIGLVLVAVLVAVVALVLASSVSRF